ncbi:hypothetical protein C8F01DRAFT_289640 [Mycena amicta]|nr:hypothetical protein C8F01DRAFT_289640 [Mycena amicta]
MASPVPPSVGAITSSTLIGSLLNFLLFGTLLVQIYVYNVCFPADRAPIKYLVYTVFLAMTLCTALNAADAQFWFAANFGDLQKFGEIRFSGFYTPIMGSIIALCVQLFYCYRIMVFRRETRRQVVWIVGVIALASVLQAIGGIGGGIKAYIEHNEEHDHARTVLVYMWLVGDAIADILIAITMTHILSKATAENTKQMVRGVVRIVVETNAFSASVALLGLILFAGVPNTTYFICPTMILPGIYANTLLVVLNNRAFASGAVRARTRPSNTNSDDLHFTTADAGASSTVVGAGSASRALQISRSHSMRVQDASKRLQGDTLQPLRRPRGNELGHSTVGEDADLGAFVAAGNPNAHDTLDFSEQYVDDVEQDDDDELGSFVPGPGPGPRSPKRRGVSWGSGSTMTRAGAGSTDQGHGRHQSERSSKSGWSEP